VFEVQHISYLMTFIMELAEINYTELSQSKSAYNI